MDTFSLRKSFVRISITDDIYSETSQCEHPKNVNTPNSEHFSLVSFFPNTFQLHEEWTPPNPNSAHFSGFWEPPIMNTIGNSQLHFVCFSTVHAYYLHFKWSSQVTV